MGWAGHELQWQHNPGNRGNDIKTLYTVPTAEEAKPLLAQYGIDYVVFGPIERTTYGDAGRREVRPAGQARLLVPGHDGLEARLTWTKVGGGRRPPAYAPRRWIGGDKGRTMSGLLRCGIGSQRVGSSASA